MLQALEISWHLHRCGPAACRPRLTASPIGPFWPGLNPACARTRRGPIRRPVETAKGRAAARLSVLACLRRVSAQSLRGARHITSPPAPTARSAAKLASALSRGSRAPPPLGRSLPPPNRRGIGGKPDRRNHGNDSEPALRWGPSYPLQSKMRLALWSFEKHGLQGYWGRKQNKRRGGPRSVSHITLAPRRRRPGTITCISLNLRVRSRHPE